jgi:hypothetical protein
LALSRLWVPDLHHQWLHEIDIHHSSSPTAFATAEFVTIRKRLIKTGARVIEHIARSAAP